MRQGKKILESAYKTVYGLDSSKRITKAMDKVINSALEEVRLWKGHFPSETEESRVSRRESDGAAAEGDPSSLVRYLKEHHIVNPGESDWEAIFRLHKEYILIDPSGESHQGISGIATNDSQTNQSMVSVEDQKHVYEGEVSESNSPSDEQLNSIGQFMSEVLGDSTQVDNVERDEQIKEEVSEIATTPAAEKSLLNIKEKNSKEDINMSSGTVGDFMGTDLKNSAQEAAKIAAAVTGGMPINLDDGTNLNPEVTDVLKVAVEEVMTTAAAARAEWAENNKIAVLVLPGEPMARKIPDEVTEGVVKNPADQLKSIISSVFTKIPEGMINGMVNGEIVIPQCVIDAQDSENYSNIIKVLNEAIKTEEYKLAINKGNKFGSMKGVLLAGSNKAIKWSDLKEELSNNNVAVIKIEGVNNAQVQIKTATPTQLSRKSKIESAADLIFLTTPGRDQLVSIKDGVILDPVHVRTVLTVDRKATPAIDTAKTVPSAISFRYIKAANAATPGSKPRTMVKRISLLCPQYPVVKPEASDPIAKFVPANSVGAPVEPYTTEEADKVVREMMTLSFQYRVASSDAAKVMGEKEKEMADASAEAAKDTADII